MSPDLFYLHEESLVLFCSDQPDRALDKRECWMTISSYFSLKPCVVTPHLNHLVETVQMRGHNICFYAKLTKIIPNYPTKILPLI